MQQKHALEYAASVSPRPLPVRLISVCVIVLAGAAFWVLRTLEHMPYRPPADMSTLLDGDSIAVVRVLRWICGGAGVVAFAVLVANLRRPRAAAER